MTDGGSHIYPLEPTMTRSNNGGRLKALQRANYSCQARTPAGFQCGEQASQLDRATGVVVCPSHFTTR